MKKKIFFINSNKETSLFYCKQEKSLMLTGTNDILFQIENITYLDWQQNLHTQNSFKQNIITIGLGFIWK